MSEEKRQKEEEKKLKEDEKKRIDEEKKKEKAEREAEKQREKEKKAKLATEKKQKELLEKEAQLKAEKEEKVALKRKQSETKKKKQEKKKKSDLAQDRLGGFYSILAPLPTDEQYAQTLTMLPGVDTLPAGTLYLNRYGNVLPNVSTRVKLSAMPNSTLEKYYENNINQSMYINANYVRGASGQRKYIATQGPLEATSDHFWRMIWAERSTVILMATPLSEHGIDKCHRYWPDADSEEAEVNNYGTTFQPSKIRVKLMRTEQRRGIVSSYLRLTSRREVRDVLHIQFTAWPDRGVPKSSRDLLDTIELVRMRTTGLEAPIVVHCSAGIGRTGVLLAIDIGIDLLDMRREVIKCVVHVT